MSSDESVSSRISQFGLYRTIDARTEEFLKLSKKRQIKQGCVCAAISTALTVTVVVTVLLIYEYNVIATARRSNRKTWFSLMNHSADDSHLLEILNKEKIDIDKTTLKLLPILLKALNQNNYMEKIIDEPTNRYTINDKDVTTETTITKNIFADTRNWMKTTPLRLFTIETKTSPIVYFKNPTRNIDYFTKIRKIRDYQRILNYVDKMIYEKNYLGTTQSMRSDYSHTEKPFKMNTSLKKKAKQVKLVKKQNISSLKTKMDEKQTNCKCTHKLSEVMYKLLNSIQQLLSYFSGASSKEMLRCTNNTPIQVKSLIEKSTVKNIHKVVTENYNEIKPKLTRAPSYKTFLNRHKYTIDTPTKGFDIRKDHTVNAIMNLIKPNFKKYTEIDINFESNEALSTTNRYIKASDYDNMLQESYKLDNINTKATTDTVTTVADYILQKGMYDVSSEIRSPLSTFPEPEFNDEDDYSERTETTKMLNSNLRSLNTYNSKMVKNSMTLGNEKNLTNRDKWYQFKGATASQKMYSNIGLMRKMGMLVSKDKQKSLFLPNKYRFAPIINETTTPTTAIHFKMNYKINITSTKKPTRGTTVTTTKNTTQTKRIRFKYIPKQNRTNSFQSKEKTYKTIDENISKETALKHIEEAIMILNNETTTNQGEKYNNVLADTYQWVIVKSEENATSTKSMLPLGKSTYLEMQRNDWKQEENHDFDNELNYIFD